jgi:hypothetical protein
MSYDVLMNRLTNGKPFMISAATARINALADNLEITQEQATELLELANANGVAETTTVEDRLAALEAASLEHDTALMELAALLTGEGEEAAEAESETTDTTESEVEA